MKMITGALLKISCTLNLWHRWARRHDDVSGRTYQECANCGKERAQFMAGGSGGFGA